MSTLPCSARSSVGRLGATLTWTRSHRQPHHHRKVHLVDLGRSKPGSYIEDDPISSEQLRVSGAPLWLVWRRPPSVERHDPSSEAGSAHARLHAHKVVVCPTKKICDGSHELHFTAGCSTWKASCRTQSPGSFRASRRVFTIMPVLLSTVNNS